MPRAVVSKTAETNTLTTYYVTALAGPRVGKRRVAKGDAIEMTEYQARALLASGALVSSKDLIDDPFGEAAAKAVAEKAEADAQAKAAEDAAAAAKLQAAADARAAAEKAEQEAAAAKDAAEHAATDGHAAEADAAPHPAT